MTVSLTDRQRRAYIHGETLMRKPSTEYVIWVGMRQRCQNPRFKAYSRYGGRGISVCDRWQSFPNFLEDMGRRPPGLSLDRRDNDGNYEPGNCRWASRKTQNTNQRRRADAIEISGRRFGLLVAICFARKAKTAQYWLCSCACGGAKIICATSLKNGDSVSCGCLRTTTQEFRKAMLAQIEEP